jgi:Ca2+-transporting ATPase
VPSIGTVPEPDANAPEPTPWHALDGGDALLRLGASVEGLSPAEAARRLQRSGPNALPERRRRSGLAVFLDQFRSPLIYLLLLAAAIAAGLGERRDAAVILGVLLVNAAVGAFQEGRAQRSMEALRRLAGLQVRVRRAGQEEVLEARQLVPGDLLLLSAGDAVGADARILEASRLATLEAALTGESLPVPKQVAPVEADTALADRASLVFAGTHVATGRGLAVVAATGPSTEVGRIAALAESGTAARTPLERRLAGLGRLLALAALGVFALVLAVGLLRALPLTDILMVALSQLVSTVPEGLPVAMTVGLAVGMQRMAARRAIVRRLAAVESLGSTTVICTDKTGTLTRNELTAVEAWLPGGRRLRASGTGWDPAGRITEGQRSLDAASDPGLSALLRAALLCNDAELLPPEGGQAGWRIAGDPTEAALVALARKGGLDADRERAAWPRTDEVPFDGARKLMVTVNRGAAGTAAFVKGAPEAVLELCGAARRQGGDVPLDGPGRDEAYREVEAMARGALRVLAFAEAPPVPLDGPDPFSALRGRAVLLGLVGQIDAPREEAPQAVSKCQSAGIRVVMVTGDHRDTALAVARQLGIAAAGDVALDGRELARLSGEALRSALPRTPVFARVEPDQKLRIVEVLQARGEVVAMTGDGVNDAPALIRADVGVAMGRSGTEVAKQASDVVVTDDDFATIVAAVDEGRLVYRNLRKALLLLLSTGLAEILVLAGSLLGGLPLPFAAVQILWNNVVTEGTITVNLAMEPREGDEMSRPPVPRDEPILSGPLLRRMLLMSGTITAVTLAFFAIRLAGGIPFERVRTETFALLAVCEWFNLANCRTETRSALRNGLGRNPWLLAGVAASLGLQALVIWWPPLGRLFHTVPLSPGEVGLLVAAGSAVLWTEEIRKALARRRERRASGRAP